MNWELWMRIVFRMEALMSGMLDDLEGSILWRCFMTSVSVKGTKLNFDIVWGPGSGHAVVSVSRREPTVAKKLLGVIDEKHLCVRSRINKFFVSS